MNNKVTKSLKRTVRLGRIGVPLWTIGLAALLTAAVAGQAVGPVLTGSTSGSVGMTVSQTVVMNSAPYTSAGTIDSYNGVVTAIAADDSAGTMNDEGTAFTVAIETQVGQAVLILLPLENQSGASANFVLELNAPAGLDIDADGLNDAPNFAQLSRNTWLGTLVDSSNGIPDIKIMVEPKDDVAPGFYTISGKITQVQN